MKQQLAQSVKAESIRHLPSTPAQTVRRASTSLTIRATQTSMITTTTARTAITVNTREKVQHRAQAALLENTGLKWLQVMKPLLAQYVPVESTLRKQSIRARTAKRENTSQMIRVMQLTMTMKVTAGAVMLVNTQALSQVHHV